MPAKKLSLTLLLILLFLTITSAQIDFRKFPLDSFRLPDIDRSTMQFSGSLFGKFKSISEVNSDSYRDSRLIPDVGLSYSRFINRPDLQRTIGGNISQNLSLTHDEGVFSAPESQTNYSSSFRLGETRRKYHGRSFFETGGFLRTDYHYDRSSINEQKDNRFIGDVTATIGFGKGRIEPISDVAMAMFVLMDALDLGLDGSAITTENIYSFAGLMAEVRNRRVFDSRRMRIMELRELYAFMQDKDWVIPNDPGFFTVLTDNWFFTNPFARQTGKRWSYLLTPSAYFSHYRSTDLVSSEFIQDLSEVGATITVEYSRYKPVSLFKDNTRRHTLTAGITTSGRNGTNLDDSETYLIVNFENSIGRSWFPNNRTNIFLGLSADYSYYRYTEEPEFSNITDQHYFRTGVGAQTIYFISYKTRLVANASIAYAHNSGGNIVSHFLDGFNLTGESNGFDANLTASIVVALF